MLDSPHTAGDSVTYKPGGFVVPFSIDEVNSTLKGCRDRMVVFRSYEQVGVKRRDHCRPPLGVLVGVLTQCRRQSLIEVRQIYVGKVDQNELGIAPFR